MDEIELYLDEARDLMTKALNHCSNELSKIRAGKANPSMLDGIMVSYYGANTPLNQVSSMTTPDARTIFIKPWEKGMIVEIEKAIRDANLGLNPQNDGQQVIIHQPPEMGETISVGSNVFVGWDPAKAVVVMSQ